MKQLSLQSILLVEVLENLVVSVEQIKSNIRLFPSTPAQQDYTVFNNNIEATKERINEF